MPENNNLEPVKLPMEIKFNQRPRTNFKNNLHNISVELKQAPTMDDLRKYIPDFVTATWEDGPTLYRQIFADWGLSDEKMLQLDKLIWLLFSGKILPSAMETIRLNFFIDGISYQDLTHLIRYRSATFSVECSADKFWTHKNAVVPTSIQNSNGTYTKLEGLPFNPWLSGATETIDENDFYSRYKWLIEQCKQLYCDMVDSQEISLIDARYILPRGMETFCYMSISLKDALHLINQRIDKQIQPDSDNVIAYRMIQCLIRQYPFLSFIIDVHKPSEFYIKTARTGRSSNLFVPDEDSDKFEWNRKDFLYQRKRSGVCGTDLVTSSPFRRYFKEVEKELQETREEMIAYYGETFFEL